MLSLKSLLIFRHTGQLGVVEGQEGRTGYGCDRDVAVAVAIAIAVAAYPKVNVQDVLESPHGIFLVVCWVGVDKVQFRNIRLFGNHAPFRPKDHVYIVGVFPTFVPSTRDCINEWTDGVDRKGWMCTVSR